MKLRHIILPVCFTLAASSLHSADCSWTADADGDWSAIANWNSGAGPIADAAGFTATFGNIITGNRTVTLDSNRTIGNITASDTSHNYTISGANVLTLDVTTGKPIIDVTTGSRTLTITSVIEGNDGLQKNGAGTLMLDALSDDFSGDITINAGTLRVGNNNTAARLGGATYAGGILNNGTLWFTHNQDQELSGVISGSGVLNKGGSGTLTLSGANTYTGKTIIAGSGQGGPGLSVSSFNSVATNVSLGTVHAANSSLGAPTDATNGTIDLGGPNQRSVVLIYTGSGETTDRVMNVTFNSGGNRTIQADTTGGGVLKFTSNFTGGGGSSPSGTLVLSGSGAGEIAGDIPEFYTGSKLTKSGTGTWTLSGTNAYTGLTTVSEGTLNVTGTLASAVTVAANATLAGSGTVGGAITVNNGGTLSPGNSAGQFNVSTSLTLSASSSTQMELGGTTLGTTYDNITIDIAGALAYGGNLNVVNLGLYDMDLASFTYDLFALNGVTPTGGFATVTVNSILLDNSGGLWTGTNGDVSYSFAQSTGDLTITAVPEPAAALLGGLGLLALLRRRRA